MNNQTEALKSPYLLADEAAAYMRYTSAAAFRRAVKNLGIPCLRRGRRMFFTQSDLDQFMSVASEATKSKRARRKRAH
jgi:hypothetical protein